MGDSRLRIAISGGGIASICLAHALCKHGGFDVKIFEGSHVFRADGAAVGLGSNAQEALGLISPDLKGVLEEAGATSMSPSTRVMMASQTYRGTGPDAGKHVGDISPAIPQVIVHRRSLLRALRRRVPDGVLVMGKKSGDIVDLQDGVEIKFEDGTSYKADALIGCDGINSPTRKKVLGADHPAASPIYMGGHVHRAVIPLSTAREVFGASYCDLMTQHAWIGDGGCILTDFVDNATSMQVIAARVTDTPWPYDAPFVEWTKDRLLDEFGGWGDVGKSVTKIFTDQEKLYGAGRRTHLETPTYCKGRICLAGDAAQTFPPGQGAGAGMAIEDALLLSTVISECHRSEDLVKAFKVYDTIGRPRRSNVAESSKQASLFLIGKDPDAGVDVDLIAARLPGWGSNIYDYDLLSATREARRQMNVG